MPTPAAHLQPPAAALDGAQDHPVTMERLAGLALLVLGTAIAASAGLVGGLIALIRSQPGAFGLLVFLSILLRAHRSGRATRSRSAGCGGG